MSATTSPMPITFGSSSVVPAVATAGIAVTAALATSASARPDRPDTRSPTRLLNRMYPAQNAPAARASSTPTIGRSTPVTGLNSTRPTAARSAQKMSIRRRDPSTATANGPVNSIVTVTPIGRCWSAA